MDSVELRKLFCGGLCETTTDESLRDYFAQFGAIKTCSVVKNPETGASRKFGFIEYQDRSEADVAVESGPHTLDGKRIDVKLAVRKDIVDAIKNGATKLFIGGIPKHTTQEDVVEFFNSHELNVKVKDFILKKNRETQESRGFGFLTPENDHHLAKIAHVQHFYIKDGHKTECVVANENQQAGTPGGRGGFTGGRGAAGGRGGRGGRGGGGYGAASGGYGGGYEAYGNGYGQGDGGYGGGYDAYGYDQYSGGYDQYGGGYGAQAGYGGGAATGGRGRGRGSYHPYSRS